MNDQINNIADWRVTLDGNDLTDRLRPRLVSLSLSEKRGDEAAQLDIVLDDSDGMLAIPKEGDGLRVHLGWKQGRDGPAGLVDKGSLIVHAVTHDCPPDQHRLRARTADSPNALPNRLHHSRTDHP